MPCSTRSATLLLRWQGRLEIPVNTRFNKFGFDFMLLDTAGLRKKGKTMENLEFYSNMRSIRAIEHADVCMMVGGCDAWV
jgi:predicted GTPase